jgi:ketosteroid isomerase-like protein
MQPVVLDARRVGHPTSPTGYCPAMSEESTTPDLVELTRRQFEAADRDDFDAIMSCWASDAVWDMSPMGLGLYEGAAIRRFFEDWRGSYEDYETEAEEVLELGDGVTFAVVIQNGRPVGSDGSVRIRYASVLAWVGGLIVRCTTYGDIDEARAAAERLAEERG